MQFYAGFLNFSEVPDFLSMIIGIYAGPDKKGLLPIV